MILPLKEIKITRIQPDSSFKPFPIERSAYSIALKYSSEILYNAYLADLEEFHYKREITSEDEMSYDEFESLFQNIKENGFDASIEPIKIFAKEAGDGQHRLAILYFLNPESSLEVDETGTVTKWVS